MSHSAPGKPSSRASQSALARQFNRGVMERPACRSQAVSMLSPARAPTCKRSATSGAAGARDQDDPMEDLDDGESENDMDVDEDREDGEGDEGDPVDVRLNAIT
eukprot:1734747-Prymnesium_polylepis.1